MNFNEVCYIVCNIIFIGNVYSFTTRWLSDLYHQSVHDLMLWYMSRCGTKFQNEIERKFVFSQYHTLNLIDVTYRIKEIIVINLHNRKEKIFPVKTNFNISKWYVRITRIAYFNFVVQFSTYKYDIFWWKDDLFKILSDYIFLKKVFCSVISKL